MGCFKLGKFLFYNPRCRPFLWSSNPYFYKHKLGTSFSKIPVIKRKDVVRFEVTLDKAIAMEVGLLFTIQDSNFIIGGGKVTQVLK